MPEKRNFWEGQQRVLDKREEKGGLTPGSRLDCRAGGGMGLYVGCAQGDVTVVTARNSAVTKHELSLSGAFASAKTQLNHGKSKLPRAESKNTLTFSGKRWCCHSKAVAFISILWGCPASVPAGSGARALLPVVPTRGEPADAACTPRFACSSCLSP